MSRPRTLTRNALGAPVTAYLRVSSQGQALEGRHGFARQEAACRAWAREHRRTVTAVYQDAHTGTEAERPAWERMLLEVTAAPSAGTGGDPIAASRVAAAAVVVVIESLDRLARDVIVQSVLIKRCIDSGVVLFAANTGENVCEAFLSDPTRKALLQIQGVFNQLEKERLVAKLRKAREAKRERTGRCEGRKRYGEHPVHAERERAVVELVRRLRRKPPGVTGKRASLRVIAAELNARAEGDPALRPRAGARWYPTQIGRLLAAHAA